ncbi:DNA polymerase III, epsilon subunit [Flexistipes sinusarabici DSM 4947]|uniref:DNA polymerase III, epsilon subunit n=1 Tax=Flexistipes sinusarabici (strain ATCC 49648 / DSM 4947 / MAS 10) TaxID=717231 RepID=F8E974_FLESM|nr:exonuclease domain-containing protein [Flexistipes sinusarabici]AEI15276.1 DNA polymerase III, epsilon subunit [Flexistipes sinusarabici DSM 4947]
MNASIHNAPLSELEFTVFDTETTGLSPYKGAKLVEIGAVKVRKGLNLDLSSTFTRLINPKIRIPYSAYKIHKISNEKVIDAPDISEVLPEFAEFTENSVVVAHNAKFDFKFIDYFMKEHNMQCSIVNILDTLSLTRLLFPEIGRYNLDRLIDYFSLHELTEEAVKGLHTDKTFGNDEHYRHRALYDAINTAFIFIRCVEKIKRLGLPEKLHSLIR